MKDGEWEVKGKVNLEPMVPSMQWTLMSKIHNKQKVLLCEDNMDHESESGRKYKLGTCPWWTLNFEVHDENYVNTLLILEGRGEKEIGT